MQKSVYNRLVNNLKAFKIWYGSLEGYWQIIISKSEDLIFVLYRIFECSSKASVSVTFDFCLQARPWASAQVPGVIRVSPTVTLVTVMLMARGVSASVTADRRVQKETGPWEASRAFQTETGTTGVRIHLSNLITSPRIHSNLFSWCLVWIYNLLGVIS